VTIAPKDHRNGKSFTSCEPWGDEAELIQQLHASVEGLRE
jgi:hypothetical protein